MAIAIGDVVKSRVWIVDHDTNGEPYLHASPGTPGVVIGVDAPEFPNVSWGLCGCGGVCNVNVRHLDTIDPMDVVEIA